MKSPTNPGRFSPWQGDTRGNLPGTMLEPANPLTIALPTRTWAKVFMSAGRVSKLKWLVRKVMDLPRISNSQEKFVKHNIEFHAVAAPNNQQSLLVEYYPHASAHVNFSYLVKALSEVAPARVVAYSASRTKKWAWLPLLVANLAGQFWWRHQALSEVYRSFGCVGYVLPTFKVGERWRARRIAKSLLRQNRSKMELVSATVDGIVIGDLFYDYALSSGRQATIDLNSFVTESRLRRFLELFFFWKRYFDENSVVAVVGSHHVYHFGLPLRIALSRGARAFIAESDSIFELSESNPRPTAIESTYPDIFRDLPDHLKKAGLESAREELRKRFQGGRSIGVEYVTKSSYGPPSSETVLRSTNRPKVLIAAHSFFDAPHYFGNFLFPDFWEWICYLGELAQSTNFDWYIKTHPDFLPGTMEIIDDFIRRYPSITLLPAQTSLLQLAEEGISAALTVYGTIGMEYAALGVPVINASPHNPHRAYSFNFHAATIEQYEQLIRSIPNLENQLDFNQVYEYYFMAKILWKESNVFIDYPKMLEEIGGYHAQFSDTVYDYFLNIWTPELHSRLANSMAAFVRSNVGRFLI